MEEKEKVNKKLIVIAIILLALLIVFLMVAFGGVGKNVISNYEYSQVDVNSTELKVEYTQEDMSRRMVRIYSKNSIRK